MTQHTSHPPIGIISAMEEEIALMLTKITHLTEEIVGKRTFYKGLFFGHPVVAVFSQWGKVAASITTTALANHFNVSQVIFVGVAGSISKHAKVGDIILGDKFFQHDMDCRPLFPKYQLPSSPREFVESSPLLTKSLKQSSENSIKKIEIILNSQKELKIAKPSILVGGMATGDSFINSADKRKLINEELPAVTCVDMESAAVVQVCEDFGIPAAVIRIISDDANEDASVDFTAFIKNIASEYSHAILSTFFQNLSKDSPKVKEETTQPIFLYSDGGASPNPGPGAFGTLLISGRHKKELSQAFTQTTNNRMELLGVITGLEQIKERSTVHVFSDSRYVVNAINNHWLSNWEKNNWRSAGKKPVANVDLWKRLSSLLQKHLVSFEWVKGHNGHPENERCDALVQEAIKNKNRIKDEGYIPS